MKLISASENRRGGYEEENRERRKEGRHCDGETLIDIHQFTLPPSIWENASTSCVRVICSSSERMVGEANRTRVSATAARASSTLTRLSSSCPKRKQERLSTSPASSVTRVVG